MTIDSARFCELAHDSSFQAWLLKLHHGLYKWLRDQLRHSGGCGHNVQIMRQLLGKLQHAGQHDALVAFLSTQHPAILQAMDTTTHDQVFGQFRPNLLTFPRRLILPGDYERHALHQLLAAKLEYEMLEHGGLIYVEYLEHADEATKNILSDQDWLIRRWRRVHG
jgi:hypothetical protein